MESIGVLLEYFLLWSRVGPILFLQYLLYFKEDSKALYMYYGTITICCFRRVYIRRFTSCLKARRRCKACHTTWRLQPAHCPYLSMRWETRPLAWTYRSSEVILCFHFYCLRINQSTNYLSDHLKWHLVQEKVGNYIML